VVNDVAVKRRLQLAAIFIVLRRVLQPTFLFPLSPRYYCDSEPTLVAFSQRRPFALLLLSSPRHVEVLSCAPGTLLLHVSCPCVGFAPSVR
jgi:hypothetical protein